MLSLHSTALVLQCLLVDAHGTASSPEARPQAGYGGGSGSPRAALSFSRSAAVEPFMPHTRLAVCVEELELPLREVSLCRRAMSLPQSPKPVLSTCCIHSPRMGAWRMEEPGHLTTGDQISQMRKWCSGLQGGGKIHLMG